MAAVRRRTQKGGVCLVVLLVLLAVSGCAVPPAKVTLVNPKTGESVTCPWEAIVSDAGHNCGAGRATKSLACGLPKDAQPPSDSHGGLPQGV